MKVPVVVCTPTYRKFDLCVKMIESANQGSLVPDAFIVLDNSSGGFTEYLKDHNVALGSNVKIITAPYNYGCEPSWSLFTKLISEQLPDALTIIVNDDIQFYEDSIYLMVSAALNDYIENGKYNVIYCAGGMDAPNAFSFFMLHPKTAYDAVGNFAMSFYPAYYGDNDFHYRMKLAGYELTRIEGCTAFHGEGSATLKSYSKDEEELHHHQFRRNTELYCRMWGGMPGFETYRTMFDGQDIMRHMKEIYDKYGF